MRCLITASSIMLAGGTGCAPGEFDTAVATDNLARQGLERSCGTALEEITAARERIQAIDADARDVGEIVLLQQYAGQVEDLCLPDAPTTNSFQVDGLAGQIAEIDGVPG